MRIGIIVQARMSSSRLPGKMMKEAAGKPMIWYVMSSLGQCRNTDELILSTSDLDSDTPLAEFAAGQGYPVFRGSLEDVAGRFQTTIDKFSLDAFVRICGDSPLLDHRIVDEAVGIFRKGNYDLVSNIIKRTYPKGQSVEVISSAFFRKVAETGMDEYDREHVTPKIYRNLEIIKSYSMESKMDRGTVQLSVDTPEDFSAFKAMLAKMDKQHFEYTWQEKLSLLEKG